MRNFPDSLPACYVYAVIFGRFAEGFVLPFQELVLCFIRYLTLGFFL